METYDDKELENMKEKEIEKKKKDEEDCDDNLVFRDVQTRNKMERHMSDINDRITEEDIRNVKTDVTPNVQVNPGEDAEKMPPLHEEKGPKAKRDDPNDPDIQSPWNIID